MQRYFALDRDKNFFSLRDDDFYHIKTVMRMFDGDKIEVVHENIAYLCELVDNYKVQIVEKLSTINKKYKIVLILPLLKEQKMDLILQKSTEMGVDEIILFKAKRSIVDFKVCQESRKIERWGKICKEASEQAKRCDIPTIRTIENINDLGELDGLKLVCSTIENKNSLKKLLQINKKCAKINLIVGPEGGLEEKEEQALISLGFEPVTLGNNILRVETVPLFIMGAINYEYME